MPDLFSLPRKQQRCRERVGVGSGDLSGDLWTDNPIVSIEPTTIGRFKCITVDNPNGLYISDDFIVTHNSEALLMGAGQYVEVPHYSALILRRTLPDLNQANALIPRSHEWWDGTGARWHEQKKLWTFPSGATIRFGYLQTDADKQNYMGCFHPDTEVLTERGWIRVPDVTTDDLCATLDPETRAMSFGPVERVWSYEYEGDLVVTSGRRNRVSFAVTPNHKLVASKQKSSLLAKVEASALQTTARIPQWAHWQGDDPGPRSFASDGNNGRTVSFTSDEWASFLGWYLAEGCCDRSRWAIVLSQKSEPGRTEIAALLDDIGVNYHTSDRCLSFNNKALATYLRDLGTSRVKHLPADVFGWDRVRLRLLIDTLVEGDGTWNPRGTSGHFVTASKRLADDLCAIAMQAGYRATIFTGKPDTTGRSLAANESWHVSLSTVHRDTAMTLGTERVPYAGTVYCVTRCPTTRS